MTANAGGARVRDACAADRSFLRLLSREAFARFGDYENLLPELARRRWVRTVIAELAGERVGFAMYVLEQPTSPGSELTAIAVANGHQGQGIGALLLEHVEAAVRDASAGRPAWLALAVAEDNAPARRFFARAGFDEQPSDTGHYPGGQRSLGMRKKL